MRVQDMMDLLKVYDGIDSLFDVMEELIGIRLAVGFNDGIIGGMMYIENIIERNSVLFDPYCEENQGTMKVYFDMLCNRKYTYEYRAKTMLGIDTHLQTIQKED